MENFLVSARKYRPLRWSDVMGQDHVARTLKNALQKNQVAHAFLFCGPRGVGKTTCARILARVLNCENPSSEWEPCNECSTCISFQENASFNIFELDAASNNSVDDIRVLVEQVRYQPQYGKYKIYIVDEVHMLSSQAFNAFLKTLEEPPPYAKFILATTEKHKILPTILSRCQIYDFKRISEHDIILQLQKICTRESIEAEDKALAMIAQKADGALRDALSIFDRISSYSGKKISYDDVLSNLNILDTDYYFKFTEAFITEDSSKALILLNKIIQNGFDPEVFLDGIALHMRNLLMCKNEDLIGLLDVSAVWSEKYKQQAEVCSPSFLMTALHNINETEVNLSRAKNKRLHTEILILKLCSQSHQKKNPEPQIISSNTTIPSSNISTTQSNLKEIDTKPVLPQVESQQKTATSPPLATISTPPKESISSPVSNSSSGKKLPTLAGLDILRKKIIEDEQAKKINSKQISIEHLQEFWDELKQETDSASLRVTMNNTQIILESNTIKFLVASLLSKESIRQELKLEEKLRTQFDAKDYSILIEIDPVMAESLEKEKPKVFTSKEKWDSMLEKNPLIVKFKETLNLKLHED